MVKKEVFEWIRRKENRNSMPPPKILLDAGADSLELRFSRKLSFLTFS